MVTLAYDPGSLSPALAPWDTISKNKQGKSDNAVFSSFHITCSTTLVATQKLILRGNH